MNTDPVNLQDCTAIHANTRLKPEFQPNPSEYNLVVILAPVRSPAAVESSQELIRLIVIF